MPATSGLKTSTPSRALEAYMADARGRVDAVLERWAAHSERFWPSPVAAAVRYSLLSTGKRLRPTLVVACYEAVGGGSPAVVELAAAVEVVHAYSLVHDDLPCMDNDDLRRGRPTTHRAFDVRTATEAGYHMVALAARVLAAGLDALGLDSERREGIALELYRAAGAGGMIGGQALDLAAGAAPASCEALRGYGADVGLAFQVYDDVLDATATSHQLGKTAGKDAALAKSTFVTLLGVGAARAEAERLAARAVDRLRRAGLVSPTLVELAHYIVTRPN